LVNKEPLFELVWGVGHGSSRPGCPPQACCTSLLRFPPFAWSKQSGLPGRIVLLALGDAIPPFPPTTLAFLSHQ
jgi:hypothetical protein